MDEMAHMAQGSVARENTVLSGDPDQIGHMAKAQSGSSQQQQSAAGDLTQSPKISPTTTR